MKKVIKLTESDLTRIVRRVIKENEDENLFHKKTKENGVFISVKETSAGNFEFYVSDDNFNQVHSFYGDRGLAEGVFLQTKLHVQDGKDAERVFNYIVKKLDSLNENDLVRIVRRVIKEDELPSFEGSAEPMELVYSPGMGEIASVDTLDIIARKRGESEDIYNRFVDEFENGDFDYIELNGGRYDEDSPKIMRMLDKIGNFVSNPDECVFLTHPQWLVRFLRSTDKLYIVKYYGDLFT